MSIINTRPKFLRPHYNNLREWMEDRQNVYIGRKHAVFVPKSDNTRKSERFPYHSSVFANPYRVTPEVPESEVLKLYERHIRLKLLMYPDLVYDLLYLKGKNIGCVDPKHAGILLKLISELDGASAWRCNGESHY